MAIVTMNRFEFAADNGTVLRFVIGDDRRATVSVIAGKHVRGCSKLSIAETAVMVDTLVNARVDGVL